MDKFFTSKAFPIFTLTVLVLGFIVWFPQVDAPADTIRFGIE